MDNEAQTMPATAAPDPELTALRIGVSACLAGEPVVFDGSAATDAYVTNVLATQLELVPLCPELELGLGVPRTRLRLQRQGETSDGVPEHRLLSNDRDLTAAMRELAQRRLRELKALDLSGFILKKGSATCGFERVRTLGGGRPTREDRGIFTRELLRALPLLPVEEDGRLHDAGLRETFLVRIFSYRRLRMLFGRRWSRGELVAFHAREKLLLLAHHPPAYQELGRLVAQAKSISPSQLAEHYQTVFMQGLARGSTVGRHVNVLAHMAGYFRRSIDEGDRQELSQSIAEYGAGRLPRLVPQTLLRHHVRRLGVEYLAAQSYLSPHPRELLLRNHG